MEYIPIVSISKLADAYPTSDFLARYSLITNAFEQRFGKAPDFLCRSPGRVNIIGEHIDYSGYPVLPMAIERDMVMAVGLSDTDSCVAHFDPRYAEKSIALKADMKIDSAVHEWSNYLLSGVKGVANAMGLKKLLQMNVICHGTVPTGGGLSSSSALVCCAAVATHHLHHGKLSTNEITQACIVGEHYAGVQTGGMDQSVSIMAKHGSALLVDFFPALSARSVTLGYDNDFVFVVANTLVVADKHTTAPSNYNLRVVETRLAALILYKSLRGTSTQHCISLRDVQELVDSADPLGELLSLVNAKLHKEPYDLKEIADILDMPIESLLALAVGPITIKTGTFELYKRAKHVYSEAKRVYDFVDVLQSDRCSSVLLGGLMNASHMSCRDLFGCSCPELEQLRTLSLESGALGSRLTGAGWGGCIVSIVPRERIQAFLEKITRNYYSDKLVDPKLLNDAMFVNSPRMGACIWEGLP